MGWTRGGEGLRAISGGSTSEGRDGFGELGGRGSQVSRPSLLGWFKRRSPKSQKNWKSNFVWALLISLVASTKCLQFDHVLLEFHRFPRAIDLGVMMIHAAKGSAFADLVRAAWIQLDRTLLLTS